MNDYLGQEYQQNHDRLPRSKWKASNPEIVLSTVSQEKWDKAFSTKPEQENSDCDCNNGLVEEIKNPSTGSIRVRECKKCKYQ